jgi:transposase
VGSAPRWGDREQFREQRRYGRNFGHGLVQQRLELDEFCRRGLIAGQSRRPLELVDDRPQGTVDVVRRPVIAQPLEDIIGVAPPKHAVVLSVDEKSQIQALDRTQPGLPLRPGKAGTMTHDYLRNGITTLFAALNVLDGTVLGRCMQRHRHQELIRFLNAIERQVPAGKVIHVILDNYAAHKHPNVRRWLARHPRWTFHSTPTSCSWLNAVEGFFARLTRRRLKRGTFPSLVSLQEAINRFIAHHNQEPTPFVWKADPKAIIAAARRGHQTLQTNHYRGSGGG